MANNIELAALSANNNHNYSFTWNIVEYIHIFYSFIWNIMALHNEIGKIGEGIAAKWLKGKGFAISERNYSRKWGEIDIVARETDGKVHFVEVKSVSYETKTDLESAVSHGTWRPEENVHKEKIERFKRIIQTWLIDNDYNGDWEIDIITVRMVPHEKYARIKMIANVVFE